MIPYPQIDPVFFALGPLKVRWYGLMYVLGFTAVHILVSYQCRKYRLKKLAEHYENLNFTLIIGLILGARLGYVLFYNFSYYLQQPAEIPAVWLGGMSFHGALIGLLIAGWLYCRKHDLDFLRTTDAYTMTIPIGLGLGRIGNFINGELFGRVTDVPWAMIFPAGGAVPRHPSQLYECLLEGVFLFLLLWTLRIPYYRHNWPRGTILATFLVGYGLSRVVVELFREPDVQLGILFGLVTMGQLLSLIMIGGGILLFVLKPKGSGSV
ncbi:MAG: prolipoprotein diacylglyceryl transferase [Proteobacteria bacterium]|nr:prolipoprotein diacylglyceryl transferase [Pseudomonadota bacterium]MBU1736526.1 prolipoprotein diacylglyceryl transferase [Pseudomonadota bacterium]